MSIPATRSTSGNAGFSGEHGGPPSHHPCVPCTGRRPLPACERSCTRPGGGRPRCRNRVRCEAGASSRSPSPAAALVPHRRPSDRDGAIAGLRDFATARRIALGAAPLKPDIIHGHGAKGGLHARLAGRLLDIPAFYTPHSGSLHYRWSSPQGMIYLLTERVLRRRTSGLLFVSAYERDV